MSASVLVSLMVVIIAFVLFFFLSFRGVNLFLTVFACTVLVCLCTPDGLTSIFTTFLPSMGNMFQQFFLLYTIGGAFGFCLMESGLGDAMATHMIKIFGEKWIAVALFVITCLMMAAGVASYQYAVLAISLPVLKKLNMSRKVALAAMSAGAGSVAYGTLIGMPNALNIAPTTYLGTTTMAGPVISLVCTAFSVAFIVGYLILLSKRLKARGEGFVTYEDDPKNDKDEASLPPAWKGYLCVAAIIGLSLLFQKLGIIALYNSITGSNLEYFSMMNTQGAVVLGMVYNYLPFMILPIYSVIVKLDYSLLEAARDLGANNVTVFRKVILPLSLPGVLSGITMVFVPSVSTFAISRMLGGGTELLLGDLIERQFLGGAYNPQLGAAISLVMMIIVVICMLVMNRFGEGEEQAVML